MLLLFLFSLVLLTVSKPLSSTNIKQVEQSRLISLCEQRARDACGDPDIDCFRQQRDDCFRDLSAFEPETSRTHLEGKKEGGWMVVAALGVMVGAVLTLTVVLCWGTLELGSRKKENGKMK